ncbi:MAG: glycosyltransferase [bacterium]
MTNDFFKDKHAIFIVTHRNFAAIKYFMKSLLKILNHRQDVVAAIIDSRSSDDIIDFLKTIKHDRLVIEFLPENVGKARAANEFITNNINRDNLPKTVWSIDPDIIVGTESFDYLLEAIENIDEKIGLLGMRFTRNNCNPEINMWLPAYRRKGKNGKIYSLKTPIMCCVAGPIFVIKGQTLADPLQFKLFPKKFVKVYGGDDSAIWLELKKHGLKSAYLNGTKVTHLISGKKVSPELQEYINGDNLQ